MSACIVRNASLKDLEKIIEIERKSFKYPYPMIVFISALFLNPELFLVIECGGHVKGYITGFITTSNCCHIASIAVDPEARGIGLGKKLLTSFEEKCSELNTRCLELEVSVSNEKALNLYKKLGYKIVERLPNYYPDSDAYLMRKEAD
ncbi:MAG: ribosomal protein S18-alanine N-acetyltransferase [Desulfurococcaceae archaeon TW002]